MSAPAIPTPPRDSELLLGSGWPDVVHVVPPDRRAFAALAAAAVGTDVALRSGLDGLAGSLLIAVTVLGLFAAGRVPNTRAWPVLLAVPLLGLALVTRQAEWLLVLDVLAAGALLLLGASLARAGDPLDQSIPDLFGRGLHAVVHAVLAPVYVVQGLQRGRSSRGGSGAAIVRGVLLGAPVLLVIGLLLGAADPVFASFFHVPADLGDLVLHAVLLLLGGWTAAALFRMASAEPYAAPSAVRRPLGTVEATTVLTLLVAVFGAFTISQVVTAVAGDDYVQRTAGLSYAEYARKGFFPLLAAAAVTLGVLLLLRASVQDLGSRRFTWLSQAAVVLTLVLVAGAVRRLGLYEQAYGLTVLRLIAVLFALWIGAVYVLLGLSLAGVARERAWFVPAAIGLAVAGLLVLTAANPEAIIVRRNVDRLAGTEQFDPTDLASLSDDAVPALVDALDDVPEADAVRIRAEVCAGSRRAHGGFWAFNLSEDAAVEARSRACG